MQKTTTFLCLFFSVLIISAQITKKNTNTLLWRITGKGLSKPSYLYGTIHLTDKKVFFLGDSVYQAIDNVDGLASELDLNSLGMEMVNHFMKEEEEKKATEPVKVKDVVNDDIWQRYKSMLEEKFGKKAETITVEDLEDKESELEGEIFKKGDMPTFLDAHLFGLAKKKGKWVGGIEDVSDQIEHIDAKNIEDQIQAALYDEDYYRQGLDWLMNVYINQRLDSIDASMYREESGRKDYIMIKRNLKMARRMDSLAAIRSTFFAVGAAHLPGDSGVISMLRTRGFEVIPVHSSKKIDPSKYVLKSSDETWLPVDIKDSTYSLSMPGIASKFEMLEEYGLNTKLFFDISFMKMYMTMSLEIGEERRKVGADSLFNGIKAQYAQKGSDMKDKKIKMNGEEGRQFSYKTPEGNFIMQLFIPKMERVIINAIMAFKEQALRDDDSKKFFQSFAINRNIKAQGNEELKWTSYTNDIQGFSLDFPSKPIEKKDVRSEEGKIVHSFQVVDLKSQVFYSARISSVKEGLYVPITDSSHFVALGDEIRMRFNDVHIIDSSIVTIDDFPACKFSAKAKSEGADIIVDILSVLRGSKNYYLFTLYQPGERTKQNAEKFLHSFKLIPFNYQEWKTQVTKEKIFSTTAPFAFRPYHWDEAEQNHSKIERVLLYDTMASHTLYIDRIILPSWFWYSSDSALLRHLSSKSVQYGDSLVNYTTNGNGRVKTAEFRVMRSRRTTIKKVKLVLQGNELYDLYGTLAKEDIYRYYNKFFDDFKILKEPAGFDLTKRKFKELSEAIKKGTKEDIDEIKSWWADLEFTPEDIPGLQSLMLKAYPDYDSVYQGTLNRMIIEQIEKIDTNNFTVDFIRSNYKTMTSGDNKIKPLLISYLSGITTKESYNLAKQILADEAYPVEIHMYYDLSLYDSLELTSTLYPEIFKLTGNEYLVDQIYRLTLSLLDSNLLQKNILIDHEKGFLADAARVIKEKNKDDNVYTYYELAKILGRLHTPAANKALSQFAKYSDREMRFITLIEMLKNKLPVDSKTIYTLASTDDYRYKLYEELRKLKKQSLFPNDYLSQEKLAYSKLYTDFNDEEYPIIFIKVGSRIITYKGKQHKVYLYKAYDSGGEEKDYVTILQNSTYYLAVGGPYAINPKDYTSTHELTGIFWDKEFNEKEIDALLKQYIQSLEKKELD